MSFFDLTDDLFRNFLSDWLNMLDVSALDIALCNHNLRASFYSSLSGTSTFASRIVCFSNRKDDFVLLLTTKSILSSHHQSLLKWETDRSCFAQSLLIQSFEAIVQGLKYQKALVRWHCDDFINAQHFQAH